MQLSLKNQYKLSLKLGLLYSSNFKLTIQEDVKHAIFAEKLGKCRPKCGKCIVTCTEKETDPAGITKNLCFIWK